jgi:hypothetical protein
MTAPIYATLADYRDWAHDETASITDGLLARASLIVDEVLVGAVYQVDSDEKPTDPKIAAAITAATCAQAQWMDATGDTTGTGDVIAVESASIGSVSFSGQHTIAVAARTPSGAEIAPGTLRELRLAGLTIWIIGG